MSSNVGFSVVCFWLRQFGGIFIYCRYHFTYEIIFFFEDSVKVDYTLWTCSASFPEDQYYNKYTRVVLYILIKSSWGSLFELPQSFSYPLRTLTTTGIKIFRNRTQLSPLSENRYTSSKLMSINMFTIEKSQFRKQLCGGCRPLFNESVLISTYNGEWG